jgi:hypothetical protein
VIDRRRLPEPVAGRLFRRRALAADPAIRRRAEQAVDAPGRGGARAQVLDDVRSLCPEDA